jgi:glycosyltransferase involved in cell wall biosynthesis
VIGTTRERDNDYLRQLQLLPTVTCLGTFEHDDRMLAAAYAAASVFILPGRGAPFPLAVLEALAAGTPVVMSAASAFALPGAGFAVKKVAWDDVDARKQAISELLEGAPRRAQTSALAHPFDWDSVARRLVDCYRELLAQRG